MKAAEDRETWKTLVAAGRRFGAARTGKTRKRKRKAPPAAQQMPATPDDVPGPDSSQFIDWIGRQPSWVLCRTHAAQYEEFIAKWQR